MAFNGAVPSRMPHDFARSVCRRRNGWIVSLIYPVVIDFDKSWASTPRWIRLKVAKTRPRFAHF